MGSCASSNSDTTSARARQDWGHEQERDGDSQPTDDFMAENMGNLIETKDHVDEGLYSRQLYVIGKEAQARLQSSKVLVSGLDGLGLEICKNLALSGVGVLTLHDNGIASSLDLASNFYLSDARSPEKRAMAVIPHLEDLNQNVEFRVISEIEETDVQDHDVIVICGASESTQINLSQWSRQNDKKFVLGDVIGAVCYGFCDFGSNFEVIDPDGEEPVEVDIVSISHDDVGSVICFGEERHGLGDKDVVMFHDVRGMEELNGQERLIHVTSPFTFTIGDTSSLSPYTSGGRVIQLKQPRVISHSSLQESLLDPQIEVTDWANPQRSEFLHRAIRTLYAMESNRQGLQETDEDASYLAPLNAFLDEMKSQYGDVVNKHHLEEDLERLFESRKGRPGPLCAFLGGILSQEVMKSCTGKFSPLQQWFYYDMLDCVLTKQMQSNVSNPDNDHGVDDEDEEAEGAEEEGAPQNDPMQSNRYLGQEVVFGRDLQKKLAQLKVFVVGSGAIGCELLKNLAMMGVGVGDEGKIVVTDPDRIERSNLSRQFLFRNSDIGNNKAQTSAAAIMEMNPAVHVEVFEERVGKESEAVFTEDFWKQFDVIVNALDNVSARQYVDEQCVRHEKPLLESGTLGTKGNVQVIIPHLTESYEDSQDPPEKEIPMCTLKHYPFTLEHTIHWAKDLFHGLFERPSVLMEKFLIQEVELSEDARTDLSDFLFCFPLQPDRLCQSALDCLEWARSLWEQRFANEIKQILHIFPPDALASSDDSDVPQTDNENDEKEDTSEEGLLSPKLEALDGLPGNSPFQQIQTIEFEKDDDDNGHMDFIYAAASIRAQNYGIPIKDRPTAKRIAGRIIPAMATTTSVVGALACMELYKVALNGNAAFTAPRVSYRNSFTNLSLPLFAFSAPLSPKKLSRNWTKWDRIDLDGGLTLEKILSLLKNDYSVTPTMLVCGPLCLYANFQSEEKRAQRSNMTCKEVIEELTQKDLPEHVKSLWIYVAAVDEQEEDVDIPCLRIRIS
ncbi:hypothetical protein TCAL_05576, partial [Tigriopus californicus]|eukprot:TCALIF_05576-PA protein Name:"Similar to ptr3 Ubiquitin-activating enzyme E1 1 (Schizosaccharomyces pombe (strain 972 / ATCC 24843))" AED:0.07 eAED:0.07 QI:32/0.5/0/1/0.5/0/3/0/1010